MADTHQKEVDQISGVETTGHEWDGLKELNNPLPKWWLYLFYVTIVWAVIGYWVLYPSWPLISSYTTGVLGSSQRANALAAYEEGVAEPLPVRDQIVATPLADISQRPAAPAVRAGQWPGGIRRQLCTVPRLRRNRISKATRTFRTTPGSGAARWMTSIPRCLRHSLDNDKPASARCRLSVAMNSEQGGNQPGRQLRRLPHRPGNRRRCRSRSGETLYVDNCAACHGDNLEGIQDVGAPSLVSANYLYGKSLDAIKAQDHQPAQRRHAGLGRPSRSGDDQVADSLCPLLRRRSVNCSKWCDKSARLPL
jgi:cytochrome c oxidase cbb3-type subunit 3